MKMSKDENQFGSLEEESLKRKERLKGIKRKIEGSKEMEVDPTDTEKDSAKPKFRSYMPLDKNFVQDTAQDAKTAVDSVEEEVQDQLELLKEPITIDEIDITNLAPRKQDYDLKRDITKKLEKLEWQTQKAIAELIRERLKDNEVDIYQAIKVGTEIQTKST